MSDKDEMTRAEVADALGVTERTIGRRMVDGTLKYRREKRTGRIWITAASVRKYAAERPAGGGAEDSA